MHGTEVEIDLNKLVKQLSTPFNLTMVCELKEATSDNHVGHFFLNYMKENPDDICQIDVATGEQETRRSVLSRSIHLARSFQKFGLQPGDVLVLGGKNHLDVHIPFYAALMTGLPIAGVDPFFKHNELKHLFKILEPKIAFCEHVMYGEYCRAVEELGLRTKIVTFGGQDTSMEAFMRTYHDPQPEELFRVSNFDVDTVYCLLESTSGSSGPPKIVALTHSNVFQGSSFFVYKGSQSGVRKPVLNVSTVHWISGCYNAIMIPLHHVKVQTSAPLTTDHVIDIINKYKPVGIVATPTILAPILHHEKHCDFTCFEHIKTGGSKVHDEMLSKLRSRVRKGVIIEHCYGQTESCGVMMSTTVEHPVGTVGRFDENCAYESKLVVPETGVEILDPHVTGELLLKGPRMACYYKDPKATEEAFTADGYYKTGDLMYRDENGFYFFVERLKMLLKYKNYQIVPVEVEEVILKHECVEDVCVTGIPHPDDGDHVAACVVRRPGARVTAQEIKDLVAGHFSDSKRLRGGVLFVDALPLTASGKVARAVVRELVLTARME